LGHDVDHSAPSGAIVRMTGGVPMLPIYAFMVWMGIALPFFYFTFGNK